MTILIEELDDIQHCPAQPAVMKLGTLKRIFIFRPMSVIYDAGLDKIHPASYGSATIHDTFSEG